MNHPPATLRKRTILLPEQGEAAYQTLLDDLRQLDDVTSLHLEGNLLGIEYNFPATGFDLIWPVISSHLGNKQPGLRSRLCYEWIRLCEANEREHLLCRYGWDIYVRDIYVASHLREAERRSRQPRKPWQQAKRPAAT